MSETPTPEIREQLPFPPQVGELMVRKLYHSQPSQEKPGTEEWKLWNQELHFFDEVGKPGDSWHSQQIARIPYPDEDYGEPSFGTYVECATDAERNEWTSETRVDHVHASDADLDTFVRVLGKYYEDRGKRWNQDSGQLFQEWLDNVRDLDKLLPAEKERVVAACDRARAKK